MVIRILFLLLSLLVLVNLCLLSASYMTGINLYKKYGRQCLLALCLFVFFVAVLYVTLALIGLN